MGVYIKGLELPKEFGNYYGRYTICVSEDGVNILGVDGKLYPVVELPPHGRLIDENAVMREFTQRDNFSEKTLMDFLIEAPTIIEAEGKDDG